MHGLQCWVALPDAAEEAEPRFEHHPAAALPVVDRPGARLCVLAGRAFGVAAPVAVASPTFYVDAALEAGASLPLPDEHAERAAYVAAGAVTCDGRAFGAGALVVFRAGAASCLRAGEPARVMLLGGAPLPGHRHVWWNFVSSSRERIERAKDDWRAGRFAPVIDDGADPIPLPS